MNWDVNLWYKAVEEAVGSFASRAVFVLPAILGAVAVFLLGFLVAWIAAVITRKVLGWIRLEQLTKRTALPDVLDTMGYQGGIGAFLSKLVYWAIFLVFLSAAANVIGLPKVANVIEAIFTYIPNVLAALIIIIIGAYVANILRDFIIAFFEGAKVAYGSYIAGGAQILVYVFVVAFALGQLGLNTLILLSNINIIIAGFALAFALSFGLGSRNALSNVVGMYCMGKLVKRGTTIEVGDISGKIVEVTKAGVLVEDSRGGRSFIGGDRIMEHCSITQS